MQTPFANMTIDQLAAIAQEAPKAVPNQTVVMPFRTLAPQDEPRVASSVPKAPPPPPPKAPSLNRKGRAKFMNPANPAEIQGIAQRCVRHYVLNNGIHLALPKNRAVEHAKALKSLGLPVVAYLETQEDGEILTFG